VTLEYENRIMKTSKLILSALGIALLATPAFAQNPHRQVSHQVQSAPVTQIDQDGDYVINRSPGAIPSAHS